MKVKSILTLAIALFTFALNAAPCSKDHCSEHSEYLNVDCIKQGKKGERISIIQPDKTYCDCQCSCYIDSETIQSFGSDISVDGIEVGEKLETAAGATDVRHVLKSAIENHETVKVALSNGETLQVSPNHAFVSEQGLVVPARDVSKGTKLMGHGTTPVEVTGTEKAAYNGTLVNFVMDGSKASGEDKILFAKGVQNGDWTLQSYRDYVKAQVQLRQLVAETLK